MIARTELRSESLTLATDPTAPFNARHFVAERLEDWGLGHLADAAGAGITELVTWIVAHPAGGLLRITLMHDEPLVFTEVRDSGEQVPRRPVWLLHEEGIAVKLLEDVALEWDAEEAPDGRCLWASYRTVPDEPGAEAG